MTKQTEFEIEFIEKVKSFTEKTNITVATICRSFEYWNSKKINEYINGKGTITSKTMGKIMEYINNYNLTNK
jgi:plasmid maintenance system antidote protein VapI